MTASNEQLIAWTGLFTVLSVPRYRRKNKNKKIPIQTACHGISILNSEILSAFWRRAMYFQPHDRSAVRLRQPVCSTQEPTKHNHLTRNTKDLFLLPLKPIPIDFKGAEAGSKKNRRSIESEESQWTCLCWVSAHRNLLLPSPWCCKSNSTLTLLSFKQGASPVRWAFQEYIKTAQGDSTKEFVMSSCLSFPFSGQKRCLG